MAFFQTLLQSPDPLPLASRYTVANGAFYLAFAVVLMVWPAVDQVVFMDAPLSADGLSTLRVVGVPLAVVGWMYVWGGRTGAESMVAATVVGRMVVPLVLLPFILSGIVPHLLAAFAVLDPALALGALVLLRRQQADV